MPYQAVFRRYEKKYMLTMAQYEQLLNAFKDKFDADRFGAYSIRNIYFDTDQYELIRTSIEKPVYKEKLRLRCYGVPGPEDDVFVELKKKYDGIVYKRRISMTLCQAEQYLYDDDKNVCENSQIMKEIAWVRQKYHLKPVVRISYDRKAYCGAENNQLRMTFDTNILAESGMLRLSGSNSGMPLLENEQVLMELKIPDAMPVWMCHTLSGLGIFPISFSKYGAFYKKVSCPKGRHKENGETFSALELSGQKNMKGGRCYA